MTPAKFKVIFFKKDQLTQDVFTFYFQRPQGFEFTAGQYNRWIIPITNPDERGNSRYFTVSSPPSKKDYLTFTTKINISAFKKTLVTFKEGQEIEIFGPLGSFTLSEPALQHVFIAGGIGVTPYHSMIAETFENGQSVPITLFASFSTTEDIVFNDEFNLIQQKTQWFKYFPTISKPEFSKLPWQGLTGRINQELIASKVKDIGAAIFYFCGPPAMVEALRQTLQELQIPADHMKVEKFTGY